MDNLSINARGLIAGILVSASIFAVAGVILCSYFFRISAVSFILGLLLVTLVNVMKTVLLDRAVSKAVEMEGKSASGYIQLQYFIRTALTAVILLVAALSPYISIYGAVAGILAMSVATLCIRIFAKKEDAPIG